MKPRFKLNNTLWPQELRTEGPPPAAGQHVRMRLNNTEELLKRQDEMCRLRPDKSAIISYLPRREQDGVLSRLGLPPALRGSRDGLTRFYCIFSLHLEHHSLLDVIHKVSAPAFAQRRGE